MSETLNEEQVRSALATVTHPMIDKSLLELGIIRSVNVEGGTVKCVVAFPFPQVPIAQQIFNSIEEPLAALGARVEFEQTVMTMEERQRFFTLEREGWRGGM